MSRGLPALLALACFFATQLSWASRYRIEASTPLMSPMRAFTHGGQGGFSNAFAIDIDGLDKNDGELGDAHDTTADAGWGREILAPAAGSV